MNRDALLAKVRGVEGYLSDDEAWALYRAVCDNAAQAPRVVEIGSYKGKSTIALASALVEKGAGSLVAVDPHAPTGKESYVREHGEQDTYAEFERNVAYAGVSNYVTSIRATSRDARKRYDMRPIDVLFIDGSHDYDDVLADIDTWTPLVNRDGIVAFNDTYVPGVNLAIRERIASGFLPLSDFRHVNNTLFGRYRSSRRRSIWLGLYFAVERMRFKLLKLMLKGLLEALGVIYVRPSTIRSPSWKLLG